MARLLVAALAALIATVGLARAADAPAKPNVLFCFADDWGRYASAYAATDGPRSPNHVVKTPNVDRVAARGVLFRNAFVNAPSCTPCRSSLLSGRYFFNTGRGAILNGAVWDPAIPSFPLLLKDAGYAIGKTGKVWSPGTPADAPFGGQAYAFQAAGMRHNNFSEQVTAAVKNGQTVPAARAEMLAEVRGNVDAFLAGREKGRPFLYFFGPTTVHRTWVKGSGKALWNIDPDALKGRLPGRLPDVPEVREDFADYLGEIQAFDAYVGVLLDRLAAAGELDRTVVVVSGDHGAPGFPGGKCNLYDFGTAVSLAIAGPGVTGGRVVDDFVTLPDLCPTLLDLGGAKSPPGMAGKSLVPVLASDKSGLVDPARTWVIAGRERHVAAARDGNLPYPSRALRTPEFLYVRNYAPDRTPMGDPKGVTATEAPTIAALTNSTYAAFADMDASPTKAWLVTNRTDPKWQPFYEAAFGPRPAEELYDLKADPDQLKNVAADPAYSKQRAEQSERLMKILTAAGDPRVTDEECPFDRPPFTDVVVQKKK